MRLPPLALATALSATALSADNNAPTPAAPVAATTAASSPPNRARALSPTATARIAEQLPKFTPPKTPTPPAERSPVLVPSPPSAPTVASVPDQPRNTIVRLPNYVVREEKPAAFQERHILTFKGRLDLAYRRHPGLHLGSLPFLSNNGIALAMLEEEFRLERKAEMEELAGRVTAPTERAKAQTDVQKTFMRIDWLPARR